ncbi:UNVERIFIED_CONTAM: hypothetical protein Sangu_0379000 [Sesamum angustifolium]|uniref:Uncharacterized protein n=1 Tax=Sesamum angustifolium TaxID=2727405 RepID=A0AAW2QST1_9LAMI
MYGQSVQFYEGDSNSRSFGVVAASASSPFGDVSLAPQGPAGRTRGVSTSATQSTRSGGELVTCDVIIDVDSGDNQ